MRKPAFYICENKDTDQLRGDQLHGNHEADQRLCFHYISDPLCISKFLLQFGQVVEAPADFYSSRIPKKQRKSTMVEELLADAEFRR